MDVSDYTMRQGDFLKALDVITNPQATFVITGEGKFVDSNFKEGSKRLHVEGEFNKQKKIFDMGKTNARKVEETLGSDTTKWVGKVLTLETYKTKTSEGKLVDAINVKSVIV